MANITSYFACTDIVQCTYLYQRSLILIQRSQKCNLSIELMTNQGENIERFKRFRLKSCRSIGLPVKSMASGAPRCRGHIITGIFSTDKVLDDPHSLQYLSDVSFSSASAPLTSILSSILSPPAASCSLHIILIIHPSYLSSHHISHPVKSGGEEARRRRGGEEARSRRGGGEEERRCYIR